MQPHQIRVIREKVELDTKIEGLSAFIGGATFETVDLAERARLRRQLPVMRQYAEILGERIKAFDQ